VRKGGREGERERMWRWRGVNKGVD